MLMLMIEGIERTGSTCRHALCVWIKMKRSCQKRERTRDRDRSANPEKTQWNSQITQSTWSTERVSSRKKAGETQYRTQKRGMIDVTTEQWNSMESESVVVIVIWNESECERVMVQISEERREEREMGGSSGRAYPVVIFVADRERERERELWLCGAPMHTVVRLRRDPEGTVAPFHGMPVVLLSLALCPGGSSGLSDRQRQLVSGC